MGWGTPPLVNGGIDRDADTRADPDLLRAAWAEPGTRVLRMRGQEVAVVEADGGLRLALGAASGEYDLSGANGLAVGHLYLGRREGEPVFAVAVQAAADEEPSGNAFEDGTTVRAEQERWAHPFQVAAELSAPEAELLSIASALLRWHESAVFSPRDGGATTPALGGWARHDAHGGEHFPRTDPAVIVLIEHEDRVLLGSNALWETGRFSLLAGFVEAAESLEQTVIREVFEEAGVRLGDIEYVASQPWPFPRSLMFGFRARLADGADPLDLNPDPSEISELRWLTREEVSNPAPGLMLPRGLSIARWMLDKWVEEGDRQSADSQPDAR